jgi:hydrogenase nickel incorporation protein HypB
LNPEPQSLLAIENVGNLACPSLFDLGEHSKVVVMSVTEGEDKPVKYPHIFRAATALVVTKIDLLPFLEFDLDRALSCALSVNQHLRPIMVSATHGQGMDSWVQWVQWALQGERQPQPSVVEANP